MVWRMWLEGMGRYRPRAEPWLDVLLPLALLVVGWQRGGDPPALVLIVSLWLALKLAFQAVLKPIYWVLLGVLLACEASLQQQQVAVSAPTDLVLFLLAFAAGLGRTPSQWRVTAWLIASMALVALTAGHWVSEALNSNAALLPWGVLRQEVQDAVMRIGGIAINRSAYLLGFVVLSAWWLFRYSKHPLARCLALVLAVLAYGLAFLTGSRAGAGLPVLVILLAETCCFYRQCLSDCAGRIAASFLAVLISFAVFLYQPGSPLAYRNVSDSGRAEVAHCFLRHSLSGPVELLIGHGGNETAAACRAETRDPRYFADGLRHAHNVFLQILADHGAIFLFAFLVLILLVLRRSLLVIASGGSFQGFMALSYGCFFMGFGLIESTLIHVSLLQACSGYFLASAWPCLDGACISAGSGSGRK